MDLIRDQGFREQRGEYGSRVGGDSLDVGVLYLQSTDSFFYFSFINFVAVFWQVPVPRFAVGIVIGRNGEMIKKIQNDTGVRIQFKPGK